MIHSETWTALKKLLGVSRNLSFTLDYARRANGPAWSAVILTEKGRVVGRATAGEADAAVRKVIEVADLRGVGRPRKKGDF